jgi:hypothetical protein
VLRDLDRASVVGVRARGSPGSQAVDHPVVHATSSLVRLRGSRWTTRASATSAAILGPSPPQSPDLTPSTRASTPPAFPRRSSSLANSPWTARPGDTLIAATMPGASARAPTMGVSADRFLRSSSRTILGSPQ